MWEWNCWGVSNIAFVSKKWSNRAQTLVCFSGTRLLPPSLGASILLLFWPEIHTVQFRATKRCVSYHWASNDEGRTKLRLVSSIFLQLRRPSSHRLRQLCRYLLHHHRLTSLLPWRPHWYRHLRHRRPRFQHCYLLLDLFPRRHHSPLGFRPSQMHQNNWPKTSHFLYGTLSNDFLIFIFIFFIINFNYEYCRWYLRYFHRKKNLMERSILHMCVCKLKMGKIINLNFVLHRLGSVIWQIFTSFPKLHWKRYNYFLLFFYIFF